MKKIAFVLAAAGLMSLAACHKTDATATNNEADMAIDNASADNMDTMVDNSSETVASNAMDSNAATTNM